MLAASVGLGGLPGERIGPARAAAQAGPDVSITKSAVDVTSGLPTTTYTAGTHLSFNLVVQNHGPGNATGLRVTDTLPDGLIPVFASGPGWNCTYPGQLVTCTKSTLTVTSNTIVIRVSAASSLTGPQTNTATVTADVDTDPSDNTATVTVDPAPVADLVITKYSLNSPIAGESLSYEVSVTNLGPSDIGSYTVTDPLDPRLTYVEAVGITCTPSNQDLSCDGGALIAGQTSNFTIDVTVDPAFPPGEELDNTATVTPPAGTTDPNMSNNSSTDTTDVEAIADLFISKTHAGTAVAGEETSFGIVVTNTGPSTDQPAGDITVTDTPPAGMSYVSATGTDWSCTPASGTVTCNYGQDLDANDTTAVITLTVAVSPVLRGSVTNTAQVAATVPDPDLGNNTSSASVTITAEADLELSKTHTDDFVAGAHASFTFVVTNHGPSSDAPSFTVTDTLDPDLTFVEATGEASCDATGQVVTCTGGSLSPQGTATFTMRVAVAADTGPRSVTNTATVTPPAGTTDPDPSNATATDTATVRVVADLSLTKTALGEFSPGDRGQYQLTVRNLGPSDVPSFTITDTLDARLSYAGATGDASCTADQQDVTCTGGELAATGTATVVLDVDVAADVPEGTTIHNTAAVDVPSGVDDPNPDNRTSEVSVTVEHLADLAISKTHTGAFVAGQDARYEITVTNQGATAVPADAVRVTDELPAGLSFVSADGDRWTCTASGSTVTCRLGGALGPGDASTVVLHVHIAPDARGEAVNQATITAPETEPDQPNVATDTVTVETLADLAAALTHEQRRYQAGDPVDFTLTVVNHGTSTAREVVVRQTLPDGVQFPAGDSAPARGSGMELRLVSQTSSAQPSWPLRCAVDGGQRLVCRTSTLPVGSYQTQVRALIGPQLTGSFASVLEVSAATPDPDLDNNRATDTVSDIRPVGAPEPLPPTGGRLYLLLGLAGLTLLAAVPLLAVGRPPVFRPPGRRRGRATVIAALP